MGQVVVCLLSKDEAVSSILSLTNNNNMLNIFKHFHTFVGHLYIFFGEISSSLLPIFIRFIYCRSSFYIFWILTRFTMIHTDVFP
jgi:hypothetical protein